MQGVEGDIPPLIAHYSSNITYLQGITSDWGDQVDQAPPGGVINLENRFMLDSNKVCASLVTVGGGGTYIYIHVYTHDLYSVANSKLWNLVGHKDGSCTHFCGSSHVYIVYVHVSVAGCGHPGVLVVSGLLNYNEDINFRGIRKDSTVCIKK